MPSGATDVIFRCPTSAVSLMEIGTIHGALDFKTDEDNRFISELVLSAHKTVLERIQAFLGERVGVSGTMGNPVIVSDAIRCAEDALHDALHATFNPKYLFKPPFSNEETRKKVFADYLFRFCDWGPAGDWDHAGVTYCVEGSL